MYIFDQGLFQALWSIAFTSKRHFDMMALIENKSLPKVIYFLDEDDHVLVERALKRNTPIRLDYKNQDQINKGRKAFQEVLECMINCGYESS